MDSTKHAPPGQSPPGILDRDARKLRDAIDESNAEFDAPPPVYQILPPLRDEEYAALKADIEKRGVLVPVETDESGVLIDGHHREKIAAELGIDCPRVARQFVTDAEKREHAILLNLARRHLEPHQWGAAFRKLLDLRGVRRGKGGDRRSTESKASVALDAVAADLGVPTRTAKHRLKLAEQYDALPAEMRQQVDERKTYVGKATRTHRREEQRRQRLEAAAGNGSGGDCGILIGDFRKIGKPIPDASVDLVFTDPPYTAESIHLYGDLAEFAARVLKPGGWCLAYSGQHALPEELAALQNRGLTYGWTFSLLHADRPTWIRKFEIANNWKPIVAFYKPPVAVSWPRFSDVVQGGGREKDLHEWQQAVSEAAHLIEHLCPPGGLVLDPCCGSGTVPLAAKKLGRRFLGVEIDPATAADARARLDTETD